MLGELGPSQAGRGGAGQGRAGKAKKQTDTTNPRTPVAPRTQAPAPNVDSGRPDVLLRGNKIIGQLASGQRKARSVDWGPFPPEGGGSWPLSCREGPASPLWVWIWTVGQSILVGQSRGQDGLEKQTNHKTASSDLKAGPILFTNPRC